MDPKEELEQQITEGLRELRALLSESSTYSVAAACFGHFLSTGHGIEAEERLMSPAKQIPFLLGVLLSQGEPKNPVKFDGTRWKQAQAILDRLFSAYLVLY